MFVISIINIISFLSFLSHTNKKIHQKTGSVIFLPSCDKKDRTDNILPKKPSRKRIMLEWRVSFFLPTV